MIRIFSWNINGIRAVDKKGLFVPFVEKFKPDILCLQETKAEQGQSTVDLPEYEEFWNSAERKGYSGTAIFTRIEVKPLSVMLDLPEKIAKKYNPEGKITSYGAGLEDKYGDPLGRSQLGEANKEGRVLALEFKDFYVVSVYTPNAKDDLSRIPLRHKQWDPAFLEYMKELESPSTGARGKPVIFCGDLNVAHTPDDLARPKENDGVKGFTQEEREGIDKIIAAGFTDTFRINARGNGHYTWWSHFAKARERNIGWRIDYIFVSKSLAPKIKSAKIFPEVLGSDHCPVSIEI
mgnify:CR=1 FL=1